MTGRTLAIAVVGAGPAGIYAADALTKQADVPVAVDVIDRLPTPFGLVRYGVAPDHLKIKSVSRALQQVLDRDGVRFFGNAGIGPVIGVDDLRGAYDAVVWSYGAARDRRLSIPGEDLPGSVAATDLVAWYSGHPDPAPVDFAALIGATRSAVVVGVGNVAVDVARILAKPSLALRVTDMPGAVLDALDASAVTDVHVLGRRGPAQAKWTTKELRELGELEGVEVRVHDGDVDPDDPDLADAAVARNVDVVSGWAGQAQSHPAAPRRIHLHFRARPVEMLGDGQVTGVRIATPHGEEVLDAQLVVRSIGYLGTGLDGLPFDAATGTIPNTDGRVELEDGRLGDYVAGWIKRGPTGVIGTNRSDAADTVRSLLADAPALQARQPADPERLWQRVRAIEGAQLVELDHWRLIDAAEIALGASLDRDRVKLHRLEELLDAARG